MNAGLEHTPLLDQIAARSAALMFEDLPGDVIAAAKQGILDTIGVILAGASADSVKVVRRALGSSLGLGPATLLGTDVRASELDAALVNGVAAHALEFDDSCNTMGGHPSGPILPAVWALAEAIRASGRDLLLAYVVGYEVESKLARAVNFHHFEKGWHPTATLGVFGSAAACARLLGLSREGTATALATAASMACGVQANFGTMMKPFDVGHANRNGLLAARMAQAGFTANHQVLEHPQGFFELFNGHENFDPSLAIANWGDPFDLIDPGTAFKQYPCCGGTHAPLDALQSIMRQRSIKPPDVALVEAWVHPRRLRNINRPEPRTILDAVFSAHYALARQILDGRVRLDHFTHSAIADPTVRELMGRVRVAAKPNTPMEQDHFFGEVHVTLTNGDVLDAYIDRPLGRDRLHPLPPGILEAKFRECASITQSAESVRQIEASIAQLEAVDDIGRMTTDMRNMLK